MNDIANEAFSDLIEDYARALFWSRHGISKKFDVRSRAELGDYILAEYTSV